MQSMDDVRVAELEELAAAEGIMLPMPVRLILWFEDRGCVVDLHTGKAHGATVGTPTPSGRAVSHLLTDHVGELVYER
jgi:hypothetical protein